MTYPNVHTATKALSRKLYTFAGHSIDSCHTSYCFDQLARCVECLSKEPAAKAANFDGTIYVQGNAFPVTITVEGAGIFQPVSVAIEMA